MTLNDTLTELLTSYGFKMDSTYDRVSARPEKKAMRVITWGHDNCGLDVFIYEDKTVGLRDYGVSDEVQLDLNMFEPDSCQRLERWLKRKTKR